MGDRLEQPGPPPEVPAPAMSQPAPAMSLVAMSQPAPAMSPVALGPLPLQRCRPYVYRGDVTSQSSRDRSLFTCTQGVSGHDTDGTADGTCAWCGRQVDRRPPSPTLPRGYRTEMEMEYRRYYVPDWGDDIRDV